jgi:mitochondrial import receptor subunit TOM40
MATPETAPATPRLFTPLSGNFGLKDQKPTGSAWNPLQWPAWFSYHKGRLNLPSPGKFERLHGEVTKGFFSNKAYLCVLLTRKNAHSRGIHYWISF